MKNNFDRILSSEDVMRRRATLLQRMHIDGPLLILLLTLAAGSLFVLYSASGKSWDLLAKQATSFGIGLVSMIVIAQLEPRFMARWVPVAYIVGVGLLVVVDIMGHNAMGATRWINIPGSSASSLRNSSRSSCRRPLPGTCPSAPCRHSSSMYVSACC